MPNQEVDKPTSETETSLDQVSDEGDELAEDFDLKHWLKKDTPPEVLERVTRIQRIVTYSGPLPPSSELAKYEKVQLGAADRIIAMAENVQIMERSKFQEEAGIIRRRITTSTMVSFYMITAAIVAILFDPAWLSIPLGLAGVLTLLVREWFKRIKA